MAFTAIKAGKGGRRSVPTPPKAASFVRGSMPTSLRAPPVPRIKPAAASTTAYGKGTPDVSGAGFGDTGMTGLS